MTSMLKRKLNHTARSISPPRLRRRTSTSETTDVPTNPRPDTLTFYSWNINGIGPLLQKKISFSPTNIAGAKSPYPLRAFLSRHHWPHALCLQEVKINSADTKTQRLVEAAANSGSLPGEPTYTTHFSLPRDKFNATGFGGKVHGVATLLRDDISYPDTSANLGENTSVSIDVLTSLPDWDLEGRVLIHEFTALKLVLINGYWVNGTSNPYRDPEKGEISGTRHDHKLRFHAHMLQLCNDCQTQGKSVILIGDMNIAPARIDGHPNLRVSPVEHVVNRADFNSKFLSDKIPNGGGFCGVDVFRHFHGDAKKYTYHGRGRAWGESCDRVDLVVASRQVVNSGAVCASDICDTPEERGHSDHVPLWVQVDPTKSPI